MTGRGPLVTPKQQRFIEEYCVDFNGTQAAIRAGYSERTARQQAAENLSKPDIQEAIEARKALISETIMRRTIVTREHLTDRLIAAADKADAVGQMAAVKSCLDLVARLHGLIVEKRDTRIIKSFDDMSLEELEGIVAAEKQRAAARH